MHCLSIKFDVDSSARFSFSVRTQRTHTNKGTDATGHPTNASATADMGKYTLLEQI